MSNYVTVYCQWRNRHKLLLETFFYPTYVYLIQKVVSRDNYKGTLYTHMYKKIANDVFCSYFENERFD